jgi:hypothetical protein
MLVTVPQGVDRCTFPNALGQLIPTLVLEQRLGHYDRKFLDWGQRGLIDGKPGYFQVNRLCWYRLVWKPGEGVSRMVRRAGVVFDFEVELGKALPPPRKAALSLR